MSTTADLVLALKKELKSAEMTYADLARSLGMRKAHLEVRDGNGAMTMYQEAGFTQIGRRRKYYRGSDGSTFDALTFMRHV